MTTATAGTPALGLPRRIEACRRVRPVVGVDRTGHAQALREHGADGVVTDLAELL